MFQYSSHRTQHLSEKEVFLGTIIGKGGAGTKRQREQSLVMKQRFNREVQDTIAWIRGDDGRALERATACLYLGQAVTSNRRGGYELELRSFGWISAGVCLEERERYQLGGKDPE